MFNKFLKDKLNLTLTVILITVVTFQMVFSSTRYISSGNSLINEKLVANINSLKHYLGESQANTRTAAVSMSQANAPCSV